MALEGTANTPLGPMKKKTLAIVGAGGAGVLLIVWYRSKQQAATSTDATTPDASGYTDPSIDPTTGLPYGADSSLGGYQYPPLAGSGIDFGGGGGFGGVPGSGFPQGPGSFTSNAQWAQYVEDYMVNNTGAEANTVGNAIGKYLNGSLVTIDQKSVVEQAIAFGGFPPVPGPAGSPPHINVAASPPGTGNGGGGTPGGNKVRVPNIVHLDLNQADERLKAAGLAYNAHPAPPKKGFTRLVTAQSPRAGSMVKHGTRVSITWHYARQG